MRDGSLDGRGSQHMLSLSKGLLKGASALPCAITAGPRVADKARPHRISHERLYRYCMKCDGDEPEDADSKSQVAWDDLSLMLVWKLAVTQVNGSGLQ